MTATPPAARTKLWAPITKAAAQKKFVLQVCADCGAVQYPPREVCGVCLSPTLTWQEVGAKGTVRAATQLYASGEAFFQNHLPWPIVSVRLDCGPVVLAHAHKDTGHAGCAVIVLNRLDPSGQSVFIAVPQDAAQASAFDFKDLLNR